MAIATLINRVKQLESRLESKIPPAPVPVLLEPQEGFSPEQQAEIDRLRANGGPCIVIKTTDARIRQDANND